MRWHLGNRSLYHQLDNDPKFPYQVQIHLLKDIEGTTSGVQHIDHYKTELSALMDGCDYVSKHQHGKEEQNANN